MSVLGSYGLTMNMVLKCTIPCIIDDYYTIDYI